MITCKQIAELLMAYFDGELPKEHYDLICEHIRLCPPCNNYVESYQITIQLSRALPRAEIPQELMDRIQQALKEEGEGNCQG